MNVNQGAHLRELVRRTEIPLGTAVYHLERLARSGLVAVRYDRRYKRYFAGDSLDPAEKTMLVALQHRGRRRIAQALLEVGSATQRELGDRLAISRSTLSLQAARLVNDGIVACERKLHEGQYSLVDPVLTARMLHRQAPEARAPPAGAGANPAASLTPVVSG